MDRPRFSVIVPVYNRIDEVEDLMASLEAQTCMNFEVVIVEDGSTMPCEDAVRRHPGVRSKYFYKGNEGRSIARNYGMERAEGDYFIFFDSDCVIPERYFEILSRELDSTPVDCFGGPDAAHDSFSSTQKAINYAMTSFLTTGGIRGGRMSLEKFTPRTFNMGFSREVYEGVGGFREMFSEDIDMSTRIRQAGFGIALIRPAYVYHKRRVDFRKFFRQVHVFGMSRITLHLLYPGSMKAVHTLPALAVLAGVVLILLGIFVSPWWLLPLGVYLVAIFLSAILITRSLVIALKAVPASVIQILGYGSGFIKAYITKILLGRGRDINEEILIRKGK
ncbi:glycosyltransferase [Duncaniella freteri]|mgnify:FL=1|jgi:glycosyltransferase involved in cell wall biosynthesis|uniref:glycosyltransferase n=1 Tax=Duncaniella freteri TaxID=2530391 RepID=UPI00136B5793|nr:glycosyltransferase [Duncaniella freteri]NBJ08332.1 glycosyltransferase [Alistipes sp. Z76]NCE70331.1 glycosyltransferase [Muribaculaceae bacterium M3]